MSHAFDGRDEIRRHNGGMVCTVGKTPEHDAVLAQLGAQILRIDVGKVANRHDVHVHQLTGRSWADVQKLRYWQRPYLILVVALADHRDGIRLLHV